MIDRPSPPIDRGNVTAQRQDISKFVVHLTRDDSRDFKDGAPAVTNFLSILKERRIRAIRAHCLHRNRLKEVPPRIRSAFRVTCFTEVPLDQIHLLTQTVVGRSIQMEPYGFVFRREFLIQNGAQPAIYINCYGGNDYLREAVHKVFEAAAGRGFKGKIWRVLPFVNAMHERYDFTWEREWRIAGSLRFKLQDLACVVLPAGRENKLKHAFAKAGVAVISPGWTYEQIIAELGRQQRETKRLVLEGSQARAIGATKEKRQ